MFRFVCGVILREKVPAFELFLWKACRGNVYLRIADIEMLFQDLRTVSARSFAL